MTSQGTEQEIGEIIWRVRGRPVSPYIINEWRNRGMETRSLKTDIEDSES